MTEFFTIAYAPNESTTQSADARNGLAKDLGAFLGCEVEEIQSTDYNAIVEALRTGKADMAYMGSQAFGSRRYPQQDGAYRDESCWRR